MPTKKTTAKKPMKKSLPARSPAVSVKSVKVAKQIATTKTLAQKKVEIIKKPAAKLHLGMHLIIAGSAICVMLLLGVLEKNTFGTNKSAAENAVPSAIGLEHSAPLSMSMLFARKTTAGYVSITNQSSETIQINLPSSWTRTEVTGASLSAVTQDIPVFGFTRWTLPGNAGMKLLMPTAPSAILFDSASTSTAAIDIKTIDLTTLSVTNKVVLVQKQALVELWGQGE